MPLEYRKLSTLYRVLLVKALRPDRVVHGLSGLVSEELGARYLLPPDGSAEALQDLFDLAVRGQTSGQSGQSVVPVLFFTTAGAEPVLKPVQTVLSAGRAAGFDPELGNMFLISMAGDGAAAAERGGGDSRPVPVWLTATAGRGAASAAGPGPLWQEGEGGEEGEEEEEQVGGRGQEAAAERALWLGMEQGHWVVLTDLDATPRWMTHRLPLFLAAMADPPPRPPPPPPPATPAPHNGHQQRGAAAGSRPETSGSGPGLPTRVGTGGSGPGLSFGRGGTGGSFPFSRVSSAAPPSPAATDAGPGRPGTGAEVGHASAGPEPAADEAEVESDGRGVGWELVPASVHPSFRIVLVTAADCRVPELVLKSCLNLTTEPPVGLHSALLTALRDVGRWEEARAGGAQPPVGGGRGGDSQAGPEDAAARRRALLCLCALHASVLARGRCGPGRMGGWAGACSFGPHDLLTWVQALDDLGRYQEEAGLRRWAGWADLRAICASAVHGAHMLDPIDRTTLWAYLDRHVSEEAAAGPELLPRVPMPAATLAWAEVVIVVQQSLAGIGPDSPADLGLHPDAAMEPDSVTGREALESLCVLHPHAAGPVAAAASLQEHASGLADRGLEGRQRVSGLASLHERATGLADDLLERLPRCVRLSPELLAKAQAEHAPVVALFQHEVGRLNRLLECLSHSLGAVVATLDCRLQPSHTIDDLIRHLVSGRVPPTWEHEAFPSQLGLGAWWNQLARRAAQLEAWARAEPAPPRVTWIGGLFSPHGLLAAVARVAACRNGWPAAHTHMVPEVTRRWADDVTIGARDGAYVSGLWLHGARWDPPSASLDVGLPRLLWQEMPVVLLRATLAQPRGQHYGGAAAGMDPDDGGGVVAGPGVAGPGPAAGGDSDYYACPAYVTQQRGEGQLVFWARLKSRCPPARWVLAGVALTLEVPTLHS